MRLKPGFWRQPGREGFIGCSVTLRADSFEERLKTSLLEKVFVRSIQLASQEKAQLVSVYRSDNLQVAFGFRVSVPNPSKNISHMVDALITMMTPSRRGTSRFASLFAAMLQYEVALQNQTGLLPSNMTLRTIDFEVDAVHMPEIPGRTVYRCSHRENCLPEGNQTCSQGATGPMCGVCSEGTATLYNQPDAARMGGGVKGRVSHTISSIPRIM